MINFTFLKSPLTVDVISRYLSTGLSFLSLLLLARIMSIKDFAIFQVSYSLAAIAIWIGDFGLGINLITTYARKKFDLVRQIWTLRLITVASVILVVSFIGEQYFSSFYALFFITAAFDLLSDSHLNLRQVAARYSTELFMQPAKRVSQLLGLLTVIVIAPLNPNIYILYALIFPSLIMVLIDSRRFGGWKVGGFRSHYTASSSRWVQGGGSALTNLDNVVLSFSDHFSVIATLAITKKLFNAIAIVGTALFPRVLYEVSSSGKFEFNLFRNILRTILYVSAPILALVLFLPKIFSLIWDQEFSSNQMLMSRVFLLLLPVYLMSLAINSVLLGLDLNKEASIATYSSTLVYLVALYFTRFSVDPYYMVSAALTLNALIWITIEVFFLRKAIDFRILRMLKQFIGGKD